MPIYPLLGVIFFLSFSFPPFRNGRKPRGIISPADQHRLQIAVSQRIHLRVIIPRLPWLSLPISGRLDLSSRNNLPASRQNETISTRRSKYFARWIDFDERKKQGPCFALCNVSQTRENVLSGILFFSFSLLSFMKNEQRVP